MFSSHYLKPVKTSSIPKRMIFFDTESHIEKDNTGFNLPFRMAYTCYIDTRLSLSKAKEHWEYFDNRYDLCNYILSKSFNKCLLYVMAHNIFHDLRVIDILNFMWDRGWHILKYIDNGSTSFLHTKCDKKSIIFLSTTNFFKFSLKVLGKAIGIHKKEVNFKQSSEEEIKEYCKNDVVIIKETIIDFIKYLQENRLGGFCITAASQAMKAYRYRFMTHKIFPVNDQNIKAIGEKSYFGGRNEAFYIGDLSRKKVLVYDVNSMYPFVMRENYFPTHTKYMSDNINVKDLPPLLKQFCVTADVTINTDSNVYPLKYNNRLVFPTGIFRTILSTPEIIYAVNNNHIKEIHNIVFYSRAKIFTLYIDYMYNKRLEYKRKGNDVYVTLTKLFLNSLYGKFGQKGLDQTVDKDTNVGEPYRHRTIDLETGKTYWETGLINTVIKDIDGDQPTHTFTTIAAHVTAYARMYLWEIMVTAGLRNVFYCDTDSVFINAKGAKALDHLIDSNKLGYLKMEKKTSKLRIYGLKDYEIDGKLKIKGIKKDATQLSYKEMKDYLNRNDLTVREYKKVKSNIWKQHQFESMKTSIKKQTIDKVHVKEIIKRLRRLYTKGIVTKSGKVLPFHFPL